MDANKDGDCKSLPLSILPDTLDMFALTGAAICMIQTVKLCYLVPSRCSIVAFIDMRKVVGCLVCIRFHVVTCCLQCTGQHCRWCPARPVSTRRQRTSTSTRSVLVPKYQATSTRSVLVPTEFPLDTIAMYNKVLVHVCPYCLKLL